MCLPKWSVGNFRDAETTPESRASTTGAGGHRPRRVASTRAAHGESGSPSYRWARARSTPSRGASRRTRPSHDWAARDPQLAWPASPASPPFFARVRSRARGEKKQVNKLGGNTAATSTHQCTPTTVQRNSTEYSTAVWTLSGLQGRSSGGLVLVQLRTHSSFNLSSQKGWRFCVRLQSVWQRNSLPPQQRQQYEPISDKKRRSDNDTTNGV